MDIHFAVADILQDAIVGCGLAAFIVMLRESVHRHRHPAPRQPDPLLRDRNYPAGDNQSEDPAVAQLGQDAAEFAVPHERFATDQRHVQRTMLHNQIQHARYQRIATQVREFA